MEKMEVNYPGKLRTSCVHLRSGSVIETDAPVDNQGEGSRFSPTDMLATSLACCMLTVMGIASRSHGFCMDGTRADVVKSMSDAPRMVQEVEIDIYFPDGSYDEKTRKILDYITRNCPVSLSLHPSLKQTVRLHYPA
jgi:putative redox protein